MKYALLLLALCANPLFACLWDSDTLAQESAGMPDVKVVIVGGFARNPALYYEMRLERITKLLTAEPDNLEAYDDAAVSCDRLGRSDEAIEWMEKKRAAMERTAYAETEQPNHRYRYLANLGTFYAHRWFRNGDDREQFGDLEKARELIAQAIEENPNAHFGREKYQLKFIEWVLSEPGYYGSDENYVAEAADQPTGWIPNFLWIGRDGERLLQTSENSRLEEMGLEDAINGICGLITLGAAWESVDAFYTLSLLLQIDGRSSFAYFAMLRVSELLEKGKRSIAGGVPLTAESARGPRFRMRYLPQARVAEVEAEFETLRKQAESWQASRTDYMQTRLAGGLHPDTHDDFWDEFEGDPEHMEVPSGAIYEAGGMVMAVLHSDWFWILCIFLGGATLMTAYYLYAKRRDRKKRATRYAA
ncbi:MAG: hypothetical protein KDB68_07045 [Planctomycetes bacterium]|nr:hypothetical protein [Planctomycetota bacterium]